MVSKRRQKAFPFFIDWPNLCGETCPLISNMIISAALEDNREELPLLQARYPEYFSTTRVDALIPLSAMLLCDKERQIQAMLPEGTEILGNITNIMLWCAFCKKFCIPEPLCLEGDKEITTDIVDQLRGQTVQFGMTVTVNRVDYILAFTDLYSFRSHGRPAKRRPSRTGKLVVLIKRRYFDLNA